MRKWSWLGVFVLAAACGEVTEADPDGAPPGGRDGGQADAGSLDAAPGEELVIVTERLPVAVIDRSYSATLQAVGGARPHSWEAENLPAGLVLSSDGEIVGASSQPGHYPVGITLRDADGRSTSDLFVLSLGAELEFEDSNLEAAVREALDRPSDPLVDVDVLGLGTLNATNSGIADLGGIEALEGLSFLQLFGNDITDITPLRELTRLTNLSLGGSEISDLEPLEDLVNLTSLSLHDSGIDDLTAVSGFTQLVFLDLGFNDLGDDIEPLTNVSNLRQLNLSGTQLSDVSPLAELEELQTLEIATNSIEDITPLETLTKLRVVVIEDNPLDTSPGTPNRDLIEAWLDAGVEVIFDE